MGKKIIGIIAFVAIAVAAGWTYQQSKQEVELSDLALENVEALARGESINPNIGHYNVYMEWCGNLDNLFICKKCTDGGRSVC